MEHAEQLFASRNVKEQQSIGPVRFAEKTSRNTVPADLLWEKNIVPAEKTSQKDGL